jgi:class 3 adenylate cyclase
MLESSASMLAPKAATETMLMRELRERLGVPFFVCVPVVYQGRAVAQLLSGRMREAKPFFPPLDEGDVSTFQSIAGFLASALHNASLYTHQKKMAASFGRFVPKQFLQFLGRDSIVDVQLGDQTQRDMTILFSDIRGFTTMSEKMSPKENFDFVNRYMAFCAPVVQENGGFIDKYIGDAIMALFPSEVDHAVRAGIGLLRGVECFNDDWTAAASGGGGGPPIAIGAGLHHGTLMLGTVGFAQRMESTVISDSVNLASRMEGLTKMYGAGVVISGAVKEKMIEPQSFHMRLVDRVKVKGKRDPVEVYEVFDADPPRLMDAKNRTLRGFNDAFAAYQAGDLAAANAGFEEVLRINPHDHAAMLMAQRCAEYLRAGKPEVWTGVTSLDHK